MSDYQFKGYTVGDKVAYYKVLNKLNGILHTNYTEEQLQKDYTHVENPDSKPYDDEDETFVYDLLTYCYNGEVRLPCLDRRMIIKLRKEYEVSYFDVDKENNILLDSNLDYLLDKNELFTNAVYGNQYDDLYFEYK